MNWRLDWSVRDDVLELLQDLTRDKVLIGDPERMSSAGSVSNGNCKPVSSVLCHHWPPVDQPRG